MDKDGAVFVPQGEGEVGPVVFHPCMDAERDTAPPPTAA
jgi:hypothetical protein